MRLLIAILSLCYSLSASAWWNDDWSQRMQITVDTTTEYFIGDKPVTLAELRAAVAAAPGNTLTVSYVIETGVVTQISAVP